MNTNLAGIDISTLTEIDLKILTEFNTYITEYGFIGEELHISQIADDLNANKWIEGFTEAEFDSFCDRFKIDKDWNTDDYIINDPTII